MDMNTKLILDEMEKKFAAMDQKLEMKFSELAGSCDQRISVLEEMGAELSAWKPKVDTALDDVKLEIWKLNKLWDRSSFEGSVEPGLLQKPSVPAGRLLLGSDAEGFSEHRGDRSSKDQGFGSVHTYIPDATKGTPQFSFPPVSPTLLKTGESSCRSLGKLPKLSFPLFDGEYPQLWIARCEAYFVMYEAESEAWVRIASMYFSPTVGCWFQALQRRYVELCWPLFCKLLLDGFGKDQHQSLLRHLFRIQQKGTLSEYIAQFSTLMDQLSVYETVSDSLYFTTRFIEGLRDDVRAVVMIQRPGDLDTTCILALLQEEVSEPMRRREMPKLSQGNWSKSDSKGPFPLPPPPQVGRSIPTVPDRRLVAQPKTMEERMSALRAYRRVKGLCECCAEKWYRGHTCSTIVQLQAMQEVWE